MPAFCYFHNRLRICVQTAGLGGSPGSTGEREQGLSSEGPFLWALLGDEGEYTVEQHQ